MKTLKLKTLPAALLSLGLLASTSAFASQSALPSEPQAQSEATRSVQAEVDVQAVKQAAEQRKTIINNAVVALSETNKALRLLDENKTSEALASLEKATGKLELVLARDPNLELAPVDVEVKITDLLASQDTIKALIHDAEDYLEDGEVQKARPLVAYLASEMVIRTTSLPLATYPDAIKAITPLIDAGNVDAARAGLNAALNTLVITEDVIPLPVLRAESLLKNAEALAETKARTEEDNDTLNQLLAEARNQLEMAELLGYGTQDLFEPMYDQLDQIEDKSASGDSGKGWFDKIKHQLTDLL